MDHLPAGPTPSAKEEGWNPNDEGTESRERVYVVRLTEEDRAELEHLARHQWAYATPPNKPHAKRRLDILQSARPEHPKRREALEELAVGYIEFQDGDYRPGGAQRLKERLDRAEAIFRSLEGK